MESECRLFSACWSLSSTEAVFLVASSWHPREDVCNKSCGSGVSARILARTLWGCYAENGPVVQLTMPLQLGMVHGRVSVCVSVCLTVCLCAWQVCSLTSAPTTRSSITPTCHSSTRTSSRQDLTRMENLYALLKYHCFCSSLGILAKMAICFANDFFFKLVVDLWDK